MGIIYFASEKTIQSGAKIVEKYGSWSAAIAAGTQRADGVIILPPLEEEQTNERNES